MNVAEATALPANPSHRQRILAGVWFWERGRLAYNGIQFLLTIVIVLDRWPESRILWTTNLGAYFGYVVVANVLYSLAYIPEAILQIPALRPHATPIRWIVLIGGTILACSLAATAIDLELLSDPSND